MNDEEIEMYVLEGEWKELYPKAIKHLLAEVKKLRALLNGIIDIALKETQLNDDNPPMVNILNIAYEGVVE